ncbi:hypothetical protein E2C01_020141 [Portunus trituberculatus]|uniref:Uncharacterized protein n=1 Tax=Portunus trituberculatus TaxID=210409 RepID=A0A5B7DZR6_PORTR|nr:hypothetical protein [Portunus trituberculatus]
MCMRKWLASGGREGGRKRTTEAAKPLDTMVVGRETKSFNVDLPGLARVTRLTVCCLELHPVKFGDNRLLPHSNTGARVVTIYTFCSVASRTLLTYPPSLSTQATPFQATLHLRPATLSPYSLHACRLGLVYIMPLLFPATPCLCTPCLPRSFLTRLHQKPFRITSQPRRASGQRGGEAERVPQFISDVVQTRAGKGKGRGVLEHEAASDSICCVNATNGGKDE